MNNLELLIDQLLKAIDHTETAAQEEKDIREQVRQEMEKKQIESLEYNGKIIKYITGATRPRIDTQKLKQEYPEIYRECLKEIKLRDYIKVNEG